MLRFLRRSSAADLLGCSFKLVRCARTNGCTPASAAIPRPFERLLCIICGAVWAPIVIRFLSFIFIILNLRRRSQRLPSCTLGARNDDMDKLFRLPKTHADADRCPNSDPTTADARASPSTHCNTRKQSLRPFHPLTSVADTYIAAPSPQPAQTRTNRPLQRHLSSAPSQRRQSPNDERIAGPIKRLE